MDKEPDTKRAKGDAEASTAASPGFNPLVDLPDARGDPPLITAIEDGHEGITEMLMKAGANIEQTSKDGSTPLLCACQRKLEGLVNALLRAGADVNKSNTKGATPLHAACWDAGRPSIVSELLLRAGAQTDIEIAPLDGETPLVEACAAGREDVVLLLLAAGANPNRTGPEPTLKTRRNGASPLGAAVVEGHGNIVGILLRAGSNPRGVDDFGDSPMHDACRRNQSEIVQMLLSFGVDKDKEVDVNEDSTPLFVACTWGGRETVAVLLHSGANTKKANKHGETPLGIATRYGHKEIVEMLQKAGAKV